MNMQVEFSQYVVSLARGVLTGIGDIPDPDTQDLKTTFFWPSIHWLF